MRERSAASERKDQAPFHHAMHIEGTFAEALLVYDWNPGE